MRLLFIMVDPILPDFTGVSSTSSTLVIQHMSCDLPSVGVATGLMKAFARFEDQIEIAVKYLYVSVSIRKDIHTKYKNIRKGLQLYCWIDRIKSLLALCT